MNTEIEIIKNLQSVRTPFLDGFFETISHVANYIGFIILFLVLFIFINKRYASFFGVTYGLSILFNFAAKCLINRPRPYVVSNEILNLLPGSGASMPSGHTLSATIICCFLFYVVFRNCTKTWKKIITAIVLVGFICCVVVSRMYLGQHFLSDTIVGFIIGIAASAIGILLFKKTERKQHDN